MSDQKYVPRMHVSRDISAGPNKAMAPEELPEITVNENNVCICPYCTGTFRVNTPDPQNDRLSEGDDGLRCTKCGHTWKNRRGIPKKCPKCGSYRWNVEDTQFECQKCHHVWTSSTADGPQRCPSCRTYDWRIPPAVKEPATFHQPHENTLRRWVCEKYDAGMGVLDIAQDLKLPVLKVMNLIRAYREVEMPRF